MNLSDCLMMAGDVELSLAQDFTAVLDSIRGVLGIFFGTEIS